MANNDEILQEYIYKIYDLQNKGTEKPLSLSELKAIALDAGMSESEWQQSRETFQNHLVAGKGHVMYQNWAEAISRLEQAASINPYHLETLFSLASSYKGLWDETGIELNKNNAVKYIERCLLVKPGYTPAIKLMSQLNKSEKQKQASGRKNIIVAFVIVAVITAIIAGTYISSYNSVIKKEETVKGKWAQVENVYQRRADLIPNLVKTVKAAAEFEAKVLEDLQKAGSGVENTAVDPNVLSESKILEYQQKQAALTVALHRFIAVTGKYPELQSMKNFRDLQVQIEGSENRIAVERKRFNEAVMEYNSYIRRFPKNLMNFSPKGYFKADKGTEKIPDVDL